MPPIVMNTDAAYEIDSKKYSYRALVALSHLDRYKLIIRLDAVRFCSTSRHTARVS